MRDITERFRARSNDGKIYEVVVLQERIDTTSDDDKGGRSFIYGLKEVRLADGRAMNRIDDDTFLIVSTGEEVTRIKKSHGN